jgi:hypothetical protein
VRDNLKSHQIGAPRDKIYTSLDQFFSENPACCQLFKWGHDNVGDFRFLGIYSAVVELWYRARTVDTSSFYRSEVILNACMQVNRTSGIAVDYPASGRGAEEAQTLRTLRRRAFPDAAD